MHPRTLLLSLLVFASLSTAAPAQTSTDPNEGSRLSQDPSTGAYTFSWYGVGGRTYFIQQSDDLITWTYLPVIESGEDQVLQWGFTSTAPRFFVRLVYTDVYTSDPFDDDFDGDGVSNYNELLQGTDPLASVMDSNGLPLDWEQFYGVAVGTDPNSYAPRYDGLTYLQAFQQGLSPNDIFNGGVVAVAIGSGDNQSANNGQFLANPLVVHLTDGPSGIPLANAPVTFTSPTAQIYFDPSYDYHDSNLTLYTDDSGNATAYVMLPSSGASHQITASATSGANTSSVVFHATTSQLIANPQSFNVSVDNGEVINTYLALTNPTSSDCSYSIDPASLTVMNGGQAVTWLNFPYSSGSGTVSAGQGSTIYVKFSGVNVPAGTYTASLSIKDQNGNIVGPSIPVSMTATGNPLLDTDESGLPDNWQMRYFGHLGVDPNADPDLDGFSNYEEFLYGFDPTDFYNGQPDNLTFVGGTDQRAAPGGDSPVALAVPLSVEVGSGYDQNAPVQFKVTSGHALIAASNDPNATQPTSTIGLTSTGTYIDANGEQHNVAQVYVYLPNIIGDVSTIQAYITSGGRTVAINTTAVTTDPNLVPPSNLAGVQTDATTVALTWTLGDNTQPTTIQESRDGVNWVSVGVVGPGVSSTSITGLPSDVATYFRVFTGGSYDASSSGTNNTLAFNVNGSPAAPDAGGGSTATSAAAVTPVSKPTLYGDNDNFVKSRFGIPGFQAPVVPPTLYLTEIKHHVSYDPKYGNFNGVLEYTTKTDPVTQEQTTTVTMSTGNYTPFIDPQNGGAGVQVGKWNIQSDSMQTQRTDFNGDPNVQQDGIYDIETDTLTDQTDPSALQSAFDSYYPSFDNKYSTNVYSASLYSPGANETGFSINSLNYFFSVVPDPYGLICWQEVFYPDPFTNNSYTYHAWNTEGDPTSRAHLINPTKQNNKQDGQYYVIQSPVDTIQVEAFIPQVYVKAPFPYDFPANGNNKKTPLDESFTTGKTLFKQDKPGDKLAYKLYETMFVSASVPGDKNAENANEEDSDTLNVFETRTNNIQQGTTQKFDNSELVNDHLPPNAPPFETATGTPTSTVDVTHDNVNTVIAHFYSYGNDPFVLPSVLAPITWDLKVRIDRSTYPPTYIVYGEHKRYPAYVIYINGQQVYSYDPISYGTKPDTGLLRYFNVYSSGTLNQ